jgi:hypothetical protein
MDRKELIILYLEAETTCEQERQLADSFAANPPDTEEEMAVFRMMDAIKPVRTTELPDAGDEYDRIVRPSKKRPIFAWGLSLAGVAAAALAVVLFTGKPKEQDIQDDARYEYMDLVQQIAFISNFNPEEADNLEFKPVGDGFVMTAHFPDGQTASYIVTPLDGGKSFNLVSINQ